MNMTAWFVLVLVGLPVMVEAQSYRYYEMRDAIYGRGRDRAYPVNRGRGWYGFDDPALQQMMNLPEGLVACEVDFATARVT